MNKNELIDSMAAETGMTKADTAKALDAFVSAVSEALKKVTKSAWLVLGHLLLQNVLQPQLVIRVPEKQLKLQLRKLLNLRLAKHCRIL